MNEFQQIGKLLIITGITITAVGAFCVWGPKINLFNLPGDFSFGGKNWKVFFPIGTSIGLSVILTLVLWFISKFFK